MDMSLRAFENFENGKGRLNVERIHQFATLLGADPHAILAAFEIRSPEFALRCANNKLMSILLLALEDFDAKAQDTIVGLDPLALMKAFRAFFDQLVEQAREQDGVVAQWRRDRAAREAETPPEPPNDGADDSAPEDNRDD
ncbi:XRE family transcriptional regulator [Phenylobacterium sp.]|uniref:XRE family transcriptional regulator n=1 Tax=Phenylobacterium sp. TaxID=1871053 RepID=UPI003BA88FC2